METWQQRVLMAIHEKSAYMPGQPHSLSQAKEVIASLMNKLDVIHSLAETAMLHSKEGKDAIKSTYPSSTPQPNRQAGKRRNEDEEYWCVLSLHRLKTVKD